MPRIGAPGIKVTFILTLNRDTQELDNEIVSNISELRELVPE